MKQKLKVFLIVIVVLVSILGILLPRFFHLSKNKNSLFYKYPLHADEWQHYTISMSLRNNFWNPSVFYYNHHENFFDGSPFFHWTTYLFQKLGGKPDTFFILPMIQAGLLGLALFLLLSELFNPIVGFFGSLVTVFIKSNIRILGVVFFIPFVLGFLFFVLALYFIYKNKKISFPFIILSIISILNYPPFALPLILFSFIYKFLYKKKKKNIFLFLGLTVVAVFALFLFYLGGNFSLLFDKILYKDFWTGSNRINLIKFLSIPLMSFGILGFLLSWKNKKTTPLNGIFIFFVLSFIIVVLTGYSIGFHYVRIVYMLSLFLVMYAGVGIWIFLKFVQKYIVSHKIVNLFVILIILLSIMVPVVRFYKKNDNKDFERLNPAVHGRWLRKVRLEALNYLSNRDDKDARLLHPINMGAVITPMTGFKVTALNIATTGGMGNEFNEIMSLDECNKIKQVIKQENYDILWLEEEKNCPFLKEQFKNDGNVIYEYTFD